MAVVEEEHDIHSVPVMPESPIIMAGATETRHVMGTMPESPATMDAMSVFPAIMNVAIEATKAITRHWKLASLRPHLTLWPQYSLVRWFLRYLTQRLFLCPW